MADATVTLLWCRKCNRSGDLALFDERWWCAWCNDWATVEVRKVRDAMVSDEGGEPSLRPVRSAEVHFMSEVRLQPLRIPTGWLVSYNDGLYEVDPSPDLVPAKARGFLFNQDMLQ